MSMIRVENLTFYYPSSFDPVLKMQTFKLIQNGISVSSEEMGGVKRLY